MKTTQYWDKVLGLIFGSIIQLSDTILGVDVKIVTGDYTLE